MITHKQRLGLARAFTVAGVMSASMAIGVKAGELVCDQLYRSGKVTFYGDGTDGFAGRLTKSEEVMNPLLKTAATFQRGGLPMGTMVRLRRESTGDSVIVKVNDTGGFKDPKFLDLSPAAFDELGERREGVISNVTAYICQPA